MKLAVLGTGYVGLVSGVCLAAKGHDVTCVDLRADVVSRLNAGLPHIHEIGLAEILGDVLAKGRFRATLVLSDALKDAKLVLVAVGTPSENGRIDLTFIEQAALQIGAALRERTQFLAVVIKSTVIPGTTDTLVREILERKSGKSVGEFGLGMNPEFLREGNAIEDFLDPDRIVLGFQDERTKDLLEELYAPWDVEKLRVNTRTAEFIKYANNCLLALQISAANELANLAASLGGLDIMDVLQGVYLDRRWSPRLPNGSRISPQILTYLFPGCGFGGSCFPKDVQALEAQGKSLGLSMDMLSSVLKVNSGQPAQIARMLLLHFQRLTNRRVLVLGLAFKPDTDDIRESASEKIIKGLLEEGARIMAHDPVALGKAKSSWGHLKAVEYVTDWVASLGSVDVVVVATKWQEYKQLSSFENITILKRKVLVDARRLFRAEQFPGCYYMAIGRMPERELERIGE